MQLNGTTHSTENLKDFDDELTVVIATIGEPVLSKCIQALSEGSVVPARVLICIPAELKHRVEYLSAKYSFIEILCTEENGQVRQRIAGFRESRSKYTIQMDSDVVASESLMSDLKSSVARHPNSCVGPRIIRQNTGLEYSFLSDNCAVFYKWQRHLLTWILNGVAGFEAGAMSKGGIGFGPICDNWDLEVEWLAGCCVIHQTQNLILEDFYQREGKAYAEDLYHSFYLRQQGVKLYVAAKAYLTVAFPNAADLGFDGLIRDQLRTFYSGLDYARLAQCNILRYIIYFFVKSTFLIGNRLVRF